MKKYARFFLILFFCFSTIMRGQESDKKLLELLTEKGVLTEDEKQTLISDLALDKEKEAEISNNGFTTPKLKIGGYGKLLYQYSNTSDIHNTFSPRFAFLNLNGQINSQFSFFSLFSFIGEPVFELWLQWKPHNAFAVKVGQQKVPFTFENMISPTILESVNNSRPFLGLAGMADDPGVNNAGGRDLGLTLQGDLFEQTNHYLLNYALGVFQGTGVNMRENNNKKDFMASLSLQPIKGLRFAYGLYLGTGHYSIGDNPAQDYRRNRHTVSADFRKGRFFSRAEWLFGTDGDLDKEGITALLQWKFIPDKFDAFARFDNFFKDKKNNSYANDYTLGCSYYFSKMCRFELNYVYSSYSENWLNDENSHQVFGQIQIVF